MFESGMMVEEGGEGKRAIEEGEMSEEEENSLVTSMNGGEESRVERRRANAPQAPLVSQISENEEDEELERIFR
jgi:hypothetical protein